ncbi:MAG TPA: ATP-binding protein, partial [Candidatus Saccharimonadales bacterium]|nr:ATP-binding protein [Candidatus Saccharimonadales bacterium]
MINPEIIKELILRQRKIFLDTSDAISREIIVEKKFQKSVSLREAVIITGVRRSGKSYLMRLIWKKIVAERKMPEKNFLYFNFEDEKLLKFSASDFETLLESYFEVIEPEKSKKIYLFFDEIQNIPGWEKFINRLREDRGYKIFITGSNAALLSKEIGTALTGRNFPVSLFPLSFREFCGFKLKREFMKEDFYGAEEKAKLKKILKSYLKNGGFPEVVIQNFRPLLQEYLKNIIYRDIILRHKIKNEASLREISAFVISNVGVNLSLEKISRMTKVKNLMTVKNYLSHLEDTFLFYAVPKFSYSVKDQIYNPDKIFVVDTGMYNEVAFISSANSGRVLENAVFLELKRRGRDVYYFKEKNECDFIIREKNRPD